ncbi:MAG TPA: hypothetical protein PKM27_00870 [Saprospiraceae bacterium]|nr:hypothetical protein [Saprospiraceae bacterium]
MKGLYFIWISMAWSGLTWGQQFARQVFILSDEFSKEACEVIAACDCCASDLIFLNKKKFALVDRCLHHDTYLRGKYALKGKSMTLDFSPEAVSLRYDENTQLINKEKKQMSMSPLILQIGRCGQDEVTLGHPTIREYKYGSRRKGINEKEILRQIKKSKPWK